MLNPDPSGEQLHGGVPEELFIPAAPVGKGLHHWAFTQVQGGNTFHPWNLREYPPTQIPLSTGCGPAVSQDVGDSSVPEE
ncbi:hypothetical protein GCM10025781_04630 [Kocuria gwangalliensis]|uniref:Uncharacterized protein n=1 Tax=Kocuria gwangalliensis TaxID=501592 RepID=A0ABP8WJE3_9MICC